MNLVQGLMYCGNCGRRMTARYIMNDKCVLSYECNWRKRQGVTRTPCFSFKASVTDPLIEKLVMDVLTPANLSIAINALSQIEKRNSSLNRQGEMNIQRCQYQTDLAQRRFEQVDPANRLVAASLEKSWNLELERLAIAEKEHRDYIAKQEKEFPASRKKEIEELASRIPELWAKTTNVKDKKRIVRLLISDITETRGAESRTLVLNLRWQTGQLLQVNAPLPQNVFEKIRYPEEMVDQVRKLTLLHGDDLKTVDILNSQGTLSATGKPFTKDMIECIRFKHKLDRPLIRAEYEFTVAETMKLFQVSKHMVYYWAEKKYVQTRKLRNIILIEIPTIKAEELRRMIEISYKARSRLVPA